tara:strand:- start:148 stop:687 length:540 start_codon:yes stop_codon:yes gene_type:complete
MAEATTYIGNATASGATTQTLTFTGIPSTYDDLVIIGQGHNNSSAGSMLYLDVNFNNDTGNNYWLSQIKTTGGGLWGTLIDSGLSAQLRIIGIGGTQNSDDTPAGFYMYIPRYKQAMYNTMWFWNAGMTNATNWSQAVTSNVGSAFWGNGAAISEIDLKTLFGYFTVGSSYDLYGISNS